MIKISEKTWEHWLTFFIIMLVIDGILYTISSELQISDLIKLSKVFCIIDISGLLILFLLSFQFDEES